MKTVCFNLGAWQGGKTTRFAKRYDLVVSVEPVRENYELLVQTIIEKKLKNVIPVFVAISSKSGVGKIYMGRTSQGHSLYWKRGFPDSTKTRSTLTTSWDNLVDSLNIDHIDYAKVDIEGAEEDLLSGMTKVFPERMLIETHGRHGVTDVKNILRLLEEKGYVLERERGRKYIYVKRAIEK